jgi:hypothetical protein
MDPPPIVIIRTTGEIGIAVDGREAGRSPAVFRRAERNGEIPELAFGNRSRAMDDLSPNSTPERYPFGLFLVDHGLITMMDLEAALEHQEKARVRLGQLARDRNFLDFKRICEVREYQRRHDLPFGQAAVALGYMTEAEVETLVTAQNSLHARIGQVLVELNICKPSLLEAALHAYAREYGIDLDSILPNR